MIRNEKAIFFLVFCFSPAWLHHALAADSQRYHISDQEAKSLVESHEGLLWNFLLEKAPEALKCRRELMNAQEKAKLLQELSTHFNDDFAEFFKKNFSKPDLQSEVQKRIVEIFQEDLSANFRTASKRFHFFYKDSVSEFFKQFELLALDREDKEPTIKTTFKATPVNHPRLSMFTNYVAREGSLYFAESNVNEIRHYYNEEGSVRLFEKHYKPGYFLNGIFVDSQDQLLIALFEHRLENKLEYQYVAYDLKTYRKIYVSRILDGRP